MYALAQRALQLLQERDSQLENDVGESRRHKPVSTSAQTCKTTWTWVMAQLVDVLRQYPGGLAESALMTELLSRRIRMQGKTDCLEGPEPSSGPATWGLGVPPGADARGVRTGRGAAGEGGGGGGLPLQVPLRGLLTGFPAGRPPSQPQGSQAVAVAAVACVECLKPPHGSGPPYETSGGSWLLHLEEGGAAAPGGGVAGSGGDPRVTGAWRAGGGAAGPNDRQLPALPLPGGSGPGAPGAGAAVTVYLHSELRGLVVGRVPVLAAGRRVRIAAVPPRTPAAASSPQGSRLLPTRWLVPELPPALVGGGWSQGGGWPHFDGLRYGGTEPLPLDLATDGALASVAPGSRAAVNGWVVARVAAVGPLPPREVGAFDRHRARLVHLQSPKAGYDDSGASGGGGASAGEAGARVMAGQPSTGTTLTLYGDAVALGDLLLPGEVIALYLPVVFVQARPDAVPPNHTQQQHHRQMPLVVKYEHTVDTMVVVVPSHFNLQLPADPGQMLRTTAAAGAAPSADPPGSGRPRGAGAGPGHGRAAGGPCPMKLDPGDSRGAAGPYTGTSPPGALSACGHGRAPGPPGRAGDGEGQRQGGEAVVTGACPPCHARLGLGSLAGPSWSSSPGSVTAAASNRAEWVGGPDPGQGPHRQQQAGTDTSAASIRKGTVCSSGRGGEGGFMETLPYGRRTALVARVKAILGYSHGAGKNHGGHLRVLLSDGTGLAAVEMQLARGSRALTRMREGHVVVLLGAVRLPLDSATAASLASAASAAAAQRQQQRQPGGNPGGASLLAAISGLREPPPVPLPPAALLSWVETAAGSEVQSLTGMPAFVTTPPLVRYTSLAAVKQALKQPQQPHSPLHSPTQLEQQRPPVPLPHDYWPVAQLASLAAARQRLPDDSSVWRRDVPYLQLPYSLPDWMEAAAAGPEAVLPLASEPPGSPAPGCDLLPDAVCAAIAVVAVVRSADVATHRVHRQCGRPVHRSTSFMDFNCLDDDEDDEGGAKGAAWGMAGVPGGTHDGPAPAPAPAAPPAAQDTPSKDQSLGGLWECPFCGLDVLSDDLRWQYCGTITVADCGGVGAGAGAANRAQGSPPAWAPPPPAPHGPRSGEPRPPADRAGSGSEAAVVTLPADPEALQGVLGGSAAVFHALNTRRRQREVERCLVDRFGRPKRWVAALYPRAGAGPGAEGQRPRPVAALQFSEGAGGAAVGGGGGGTAGGGGGLSDGPEPWRPWAVAQLHSVE